MEKKCAYMSYLGLTKRSTKNTMLYTVCYTSLHVLTVQIFILLCTYIYIFDSDVNTCNTLDIFIVKKKSSFKATRKMLCATEGNKTTILNLAAVSQASECI